MQIFTVALLIAPTVAAHSQREAVIADAYDETVSIEIKEGEERGISSRSSNKWLNSIMDAGDESRSRSITSLKPKIQKVQPMLREVESNKKCYDPLVVSIGPCHHGKPELEAVGRLKIPLAIKYVNNSKATVDELYNEVVKVAGEAREYYAEGLTERFNDEAFVRMMFVDGCFILQYIYSIVYDEHKDLKIIHHAHLVRRDLFLLENQLSFLVLEVLMRLRFGNREGDNMIAVFIKCTRGESVERIGVMEQVRNLRRMFGGHKAIVRCNKRILMMNPPFIFLNSFGGNISIQMILLLEPVVGTLVGQPRTSSQLGSSSSQAGLCKSQTLISIIQSLLGFWNSLG